MSADLEFTGERYVPGTAGEIAHEHWHRYAFARRFVAGRRVLDVACGEGYGSALLAEAAAHVTGVDIDATDARACACNVRRPGQRASSSRDRPLRCRWPTQASTSSCRSRRSSISRRRTSRGCWRSSRACSTRDGVLILSSPNRPEYSEARNYVNPFHLHELDRDELAQLLEPHFPAQRWHRQRRYLGSALWSEQSNDRFEASIGDATTVWPATLPEAMYFVVVAARTDAALPETFRSLSLFTDIDDAELERVDHEAREVMRLDGLLRTRDEELRDQFRHARELEAMVEHRDHVIDELNAGRGGGRVRRSPPNASGSRPRSPRRSGSSRIARARAGG